MAYQHKKEKDYWLNKLSGELVKSTFCYDHNKTGGYKSSGGTASTDNVEFRFTGEQVLKLNQFSGGSDLRLHMLLVAGVAALIAAYTGNKDIILGVPAYKQDKDKDFINTVLALRNELEDNMTFKELVLQVKQTIAEAVENINYPIELLPEPLNLPVPPDGSFPLFDVAVLLENVHEKQYLEHLNLNMIFSFLKSADDTLEGVLTYNSRLYERAAVEKIGFHFINLMNSFLLDIDLPLYRAEIMSDEEKKQILYEFNPDGAGYPKTKTIHELFEEQAAKNPDRISLVGPTVDTGLNPVPLRGADIRYIFVSYEELNRKSDLMAGQLRKKGVKPDTVVGLMADRSVETVIGILAILKAGGAYMAIDPDYPPERKHIMLADSRAEVLVTDCDERDVGDARWKGETLWLTPGATDGPGLETNSSRTASGPSDLAYIIYTSGTSGKPKGVMIEHRNVLQLMVNDKFPFDFNPNDVWTMFHSISFDFSVWEMYGALLYGGQLIVIPKKTARNTMEYLRLLKEKQVTILNQTPSVFYNLVNLELKNHERELNIRTVIFGGEALTPARLEDWKERYPGIKLINMYGITETTVHVTFKEISSREIESDISNIGRALPTLSTYIMDRNSKLLPPGVPGELWVGGEGIGRGYLNRAVLTSEKFLESPFKPGERVYRSGDLAKFSTRGELEYLGRIDQQVKIRGFRIELGEIENQLLSHREVSGAVVVPGEDKNGVGYLCAYFVSNDDVTEPGLKEYLGRYLPEFMIPAYFLKIDKIPVTANGKIDGNALPEPDINAKPGYLPPRNKVEEKLVAIFSEVLGVEEEKIGIEANFFELGGNSLTFIMLLSRIQTEFDIEIGVTQAYYIPMVMELSKAIETKQFIDKSVVLLNQVTQKNIFCFPPQMGYGLYYRGLSSILNKEYSLYAFSYIDAEDRLEQYVDMITKIQPVGPYVIFAYSAGGILTLEVTKMLQDRGYRVSDIIFIDSYFHEGRELVIDETYEENLREIYGYVEDTLEEWGITFLKRNVLENTQKYIDYWKGKTKLETIDTDIHLIISEETRDNPEMPVNCWDSLTTKKVVSYQGFGEHREVLEPGPLEKNAKIIKKILAGIEFKDHPAAAPY